MGRSASHAIPLALGGSRCTPCRAPFRGAPRPVHLPGRTLMKRASAGLWLLLLLGCQRPQPAAVRPPAPPAAGVPADEAQTPTAQTPMAQVTGHRWWRAEVDADDIEKICYCVQAQGKGTVV